jgi:hypothetical protein
VIAASDGQAIVKKNAVLACKVAKFDDASRVAPPMLSPFAGKVEPLGGRGACRQKEKRR